MKVGYLGVGNMGQPMAAKLLDGGHDLIVYDISEAAMEPLLLRWRGGPHRPRISAISARSLSYRCRRSPPFGPQ
jgi:pyrroline-5-carboxylate reductase